ncbi:MAG: hypothetical protein V1875_03210 [Candidatus Altiarchaeota archaeon]
MDGAQSLEEKSRILEEKRNKSLAGAKGIGLRLDLLAQMTEEFDKDKDLIAIYGSPVSSKLAVFSDGKDISIVDAGLVELDEKKRMVLFNKLAKVYGKILTPKAGTKDGHI